MYSEYPRSNPASFGRILQFIDEGKVALMDSPSLDEQPRAEREPAPDETWIMSQMLSLRKTCAEIVDESWRIFIARFSNKNEREISSALESDITADLLRLHVQPVMRRQYRRYVVIKGSLDSHIKWDMNGVRFMKFQVGKPHSYTL